MKILVTYFSKTGNTRKVAEAIYQALDEPDKEIKPMQEAESVDDYSLIFCGFPVHSHSVPVPAQTFLKKIPPRTKVALFSTHGSTKEGQMPKEAINNAIGIVKGGILGFYTCRGEVEEGIIERLMKEPQNRAWAVEAMSAKSHPDSADLEDARFFAMSIMKKVVPFEGYTNE